MSHSISNHPAWGKSYPLKIQRDIREPLTQLDKALRVFPSCHLWHIRSCLCGHTAIRTVRIIFDMCSIFTVACFHVFVWPCGQLTIIFTYLPYILLGKSLCGNSETEQCNICVLVEFVQQQKHSSSFLTHNSKRKLSNTRVLSDHPWTHKQTW